MPHPSRHLALPALLVVGAVGCTPASQEASPRHDTEGAAGAPAEAGTSPVEGWIHFLEREPGTDPEAPAPVRAMRVRLDGSGLAPLLPDEAGDTVSYGGRGGMTLLVRGTPGAYQLLRMDARGLHPLVEGGESWNPVLSPDGRWVLFESSRESFRDLYLVPAEGGPVRRLTANREGNFDPAWSPDGRTIAFSSSRHMQLDLFVMDADGSHQRRLTTHPGDSIKPVFSPRGDRIAFISGRDGHDDVFIVRPDGTGLLNLTRSDFDARHLSWLPDGRHILFAARDGDARGRIALVDADSRRLRYLSPEDANDDSPILLPDGKTLVFVSMQGGIPNLWRMTLTGKGRTAILPPDRPRWWPRFVPTPEDNP